MSASVSGAATAQVRVSSGPLPFLATLALAVAAALLVNWWVGTAVLALGLVLITRPFDPFIALLLCASAAAFAAYGDRSIQRDLTVVLVLSIYATASFALAWRCRTWSLPTSQFSLALLGLALTSALGTAHGLAVKNPFRFICLELFPLFSLSYSLVIGGMRLKPVDLTIAGWTLAAVGLAASSIGFHYYATTGMRTGGLPFSPIPGFIGLIVLSLALFDPAPRPRVLPIAVFCVLMAHQVVTFTRGFWLGLMAGVPVVFILYGRRGAGARARWTKVMSTVGLAGLLMLGAALAAAAHPRWGEMIALMGDRFLSSFETKNTPETVSNIVRLVEARTAVQAILKAPLLGHGHGATLVVRQFFHPQTGPQWWIHEGYIMIWFKQGVIGLVGLIWLLYSALRMGIKGTSHPDRQVAGWCAASAACTVFAIVVGLTNYFFFVVSQSFLLAFVWGISLSASEPEHRPIVWRAAVKPPG